MEKKFYTDNFEQLLKESADNFRMYPSKRVWHSIYNDLHPSRKWPSLAVWLFIISSVVFVGLSNKNRNTSPDTGKPGIENNASATVLDIRQTNNLPAERLGNTSNNLTTPTNQGSQTYANNLIPGNNPIVQRSPINNTSISNQQSTDPASINTQRPDADQAISVKIGIAGLDEENNVNEQPINSTGDAFQSRIVLSPVIINENEATNLAVVAAKPNSGSAEKSSLLNDKNAGDKAWIEDYAFHNKPYMSKWKSHVTYQFYMTPSVGYRVLSKNTDFNPVVSSAMVAPAAPGNDLQNYKDALSQNAAVNMELGGNILYSVAKNWNLKAGIQLNYTNYAINAYELKHPTVTTLLLNDMSGYPTLNARSTTLANISGVSTKKLNNSSYQISIPLGADIKLAGKNNLKWYAGATIQPTFVAGGHSYLISSDLKNYVADNSVTRNWNLNAGVETFISYKTISGIIINAGPQFRYQLLSTYSKQYTYTEKLYNLGLKIGITTNF